LGIGATDASALGVGVTASVAVGDDGSGDVVGGALLAMLTTANGVADGEAPAEHPLVTPASSARSARLATLEIDT
jgi:hypothetical protein